MTNIKRWYLMDITKTQLGALLLVLIVGCFLGANAFPITEEVEVVKTEYQTVEVEKIVEVETIVEKEIENTDRIESLSDELSMLKTRHEQLTGDRYVKSDVAEEVEKIQGAIGDFKTLYMYKLIQGGFTPSEIKVDKVYEQVVSIEEVSRSIDGIQEDYDLVTIEFELKAKYSDEDGVSYERWDVEMEYDIDSEGNDDLSVTAVLV
jgi:hypothetical protein